MTTMLLTEIHQARTNLQLLSQVERVALITRILGELNTLRHTVLGTVSAEHCICIDTLIATASSTISEVAKLQDNEFNSLLTEFESLMRTINDISHAERESRSVH